MGKDEYRIYGEHPPDWIPDYKGTYSVRAYCVNCHRSDSIRVKKGVTKPTVVKCPGCGCLTLRT
jgi:hypothetical protein